MPGAPEDLWNARSSNLKKVRKKKLKNQTDNGISSPRNGKYQIVPPVSRVESNAEDSWGEHSEGSDADDYIIQSNRQLPKHPQSYPLPPMSFALVPVQYPGNYGYKDPGPAQRTPQRKPVPAKRPHAKQTEKRSETIGTNTNEVIILPEEQHDRNVDTSGLNFDPPHVYVEPYPPVAQAAIPTGPLTSNRRTMGRPVVRKQPTPDIYDEEYEYIYTQRPDQYVPKETERKQPRLVRRTLTTIPEGPLPEEEVLDWAALEMYENKPFSDSVTQELVNSTIDEQIPDLLIETIYEMMPQSNTLSFDMTPPTQYNQPITAPTLHTDRLQPPIQTSSSNTQLSSVLEQEFLNKSLEIQLKPTDVLQGDDMIRILNKASVSRDLVDDILSEVIKVESLSIVRDTCSSVVNEYLIEEKSYQQSDEVIDAITKETVTSLYDEIMEEAALDLILERAVIDPVTRDITEQISRDVLKEMSDDIKQKKMNLVSKYASQKFLDSMMLDFFLSQIVRQSDQVVSPEGTKVLDSMMLDILLRGLADVNISTQKSLSVKPTARLHQRYFTDVCLDVLLNELCLELDEDLLDFDEHETNLAHKLLHSL